MEKNEKEKKCGIKKNSDEQIKVLGLSVRNSVQDWLMFIH